MDFNDIDISANSEFQKRNAKKALQQAKKIEKMQLKAGKGYKRINSKTIVLKG